MSTSQFDASAEVPGYRIVRKLGQGGMATVYLATQTGLDRTVALKILAPEQTPDVESVARFENEARTIARLDHPHIVRIFDVGRSDDGQLYFSMMYLPRGDLTTHADRRDPRRIVEIMRALLQALAYAHEQGVVHRDVKPENVLFDQLEQPQLADFGIALSLHEDMRVTRAGATVGSSGYMSPEQARGLPTDGRSDLYSVGIMLYELVTGEMPYHGPDALSVAIAHVEDPIPQLPASVSVWQPLIDGALGKDPNQRFEDAGSMLAALENIAPQVLVGTAGGWWWWRRLRRSLRNNGLGVGVGVFALLVAVVLLSMMPMLRDRSEAQPASATSVTAVIEPSLPSQPMLSAEVLDRLIMQGNTRLALGALMQPTTNSAANRFVQVLQTYPSNPEALTGMRDLYAAVGERIEAALAEGYDAEATRLYAQAQQLANRAGIRRESFWAPFVQRVGDVVKDTLVDASRNAPARLHKLASLAAALNLEVPAPAPVEPVDVPAPPMPSPPSPTPDADSVALAEAAPGNSYAFGRHEVTRAEYARFVDASGRPPSNCRSPGNPFSALLSLSWREPGFAQGANHPVVCVSWRDARAYLGWLSLTTGERYRLPSSTEWIAAARDAGAGPTCTSSAACGESTVPVDTFPADPAGVRDLAANVSEWMACSGACEAVPWRGRSWHDDKSPANLQLAGEANADIGYTTVGFRVVRELDGNESR